MNDFITLQLTFVKRPSGQKYTVEKTICTKCDCPKTQNKNCWNLFCWLKLGLYTEEKG